MSTELQGLASQLEYYLGRKPTKNQVLEAKEWQDYNPTTNLDEYVSAMLEVGGL